jgi:adenylate cyclase
LTNRQFEAAMSKSPRFPSMAWHGVVLGLACAVAAWLVAQYPLIRGLEDWLGDGLFHGRGPRSSQAQSKIILVGLDDESLDELRKPAVYLSPELAEVMRCLHEHGAAAIGIDLLVPESMKSLPELQPGEAGRPTLGDASKLGAAIQQAGNVVLPMQWCGDHWLVPLPQWQLKRLTEDPRRTDIAFVNLTEDRDQFVRRQLLCLDETGDLHFAVALYAVANGLDVHCGGELWLGERQVPLDSEKRLRLNFVGPPGTFPVVPFRQVQRAAIEARPLPMDVRGAIVIIGVTARSQQDYHVTPYANKFYRSFYDDSPGLMAGPELHANIIATLADQAYIREVPWPVTLLLLLICGGLLGQVFARLSLEWGAVVAIAHHFAWKGLALACFAWANLRLEMMAMLLLGFLLYGATFGLRWRRLRRMVGQTKSEAIARILEEQGASLRLRGELRVVSVLFADLRNFTTFAARHQPQEVVALLNAYFTAIVPEIEAHGGTLNTYMGDGIMVIFGAPSACGDHAARAVRAAQAMVRRVHALRQRWAELGCPEFRIGVGIDTGEVVIGTVGSPRRLDYTAIGNTVNAAARIEAANKEAGSEILLSAQTWAALPPAERASLALSPLPAPVEVKGIPQPLELFRLDVPARVGCNAQ